jgi:hypothetical protein
LAAKAAAEWSLPAEEERGGGRCQAGHDPCNLI